MAKEICVNKRDLREWMWENTIGFLKEVDCKSIDDVCWKYNKDGAVEKIEIIFEYPIYLTAKNES